MTSAEPHKLPGRLPRLDQPPVVGGTRRQAVLFCVVVILGMLSPLVWGFKMGRWVPLSAATQWTLALDERVARAANAIAGRKIVFIGGSSFRMGINAPGLSKDLGVPVVNYGLHAALGIDVIADRALQCIKPGDIVIFGPEFSHFRKPDGTTFKPELRVNFINLHPGQAGGRLQTFPIQQWELARDRCEQIRRMIDRDIRTGIFSIGAKLRRGPAFKPEPSAYTLDSMDEQGNIIFARPNPKPYDLWFLSDPPANVAATDMVNSLGGIAFAQLSAAAKEHHFLLCVMPPFRLNVQKLDQVQLLNIEQYWMDFATRNGATALLKPGQTLLPIEYGFDTEYHLNDVGVKLMQKRLVAAIDPLLNVKP